MHPQYLADTFVNEQLKRSKQHRVELKVVHQVYSDWIKENYSQTVPLKKAAFYARIRARFDVISETVTSNGKPLTSYPGLSFVDPKQKGYNLYM